MVVQMVQILVEPNKHNNFDSIGLLPKQNKINFYLQYNKVR